MDWQFYQDIPVKVLFLHLLLLACYNDYEFKGVKLQAGQVFTSIEALSKHTGLTVKQVRCALDKLERANEIRKEGQARGTLVTIVKYRFFVLAQEADGKQRASQRANMKKNKEKENNINARARAHAKPNKFTDYKQRDYDFKALQLKAIKKLYSDFSKEDIKSFDEEYGDKQISFFDETQ